MKFSQWFILFVTVMAITNCTKDKIQYVDDNLRSAIEQRSATGSLDYYIFPDSDDYPNLPHQDPANPVTAEKVKLGNLLFFETGLGQNSTFESGYETYSCSSCHIPNAGFLPGKLQGIGDGGLGFGINGEARVLNQNYTEYDTDSQGVRPMNPLNAGYSTVTTWSGIFGAKGPNEGTEEHWEGAAEVNHTGFMGLEAQNIEGFHLHRLAINEKVLDEYGYRGLFDQAFPDFPVSDRYSPTTASFAISAFIRSFLANQAPFQFYLKGNNQALTESQKLGAGLFFGKARCASCHNNPSLGAMKFFALGTADLHQSGGINTSAEDVRNLGRATFTGAESDMRKFKVPQLYNLKNYAFYFHGSSKSTIEEVVDFKLAAKSENPNITDDQVALVPNSLTDDEIAYLVDFLRDGLYDPNYIRYVPQSLPSGNCFPNNDPVSKDDLDCY